MKVQYAYKEYDQSIDMNKQVSAKINIYDGKTKFLATEILNNAKSNTSTKYVEPNMLGIEENTTVPGTVVSLENEKILSYTLDNLGTSYYYRGNVDDNYVNFAGMCWRIVRIEGDGSVKLILEDQFTTCDDTTDTDGEGTDDYAYTGNWSIGTGHYGYNAIKVTQSTGNIATYNIEDYLNSPTNLETSMKFQLDNWFEKSVIDTKKLKKDRWYLSNQIDLYNEEGGLLSGAFSDLIYNTAFFYDIYFRINRNSINKYANLNYNEEKYNMYESYIGAISADEVLYAGGMFKQANKNYYLISTNIDNNWLTISTSKYDNQLGSYVMTVNDINGGILEMLVTNDTFLIRPVISLTASSTATTKPDTLTYGQPGTQTNPYEVN